MTEYHFIVNSESSGGACLRKWEEAERFLKEQQVPYTVHFPNDEGKRQIIDHVPDHGTNSSGYQTDPVQTDNETDVPNR